MAFEGTKGALESFGVAGGIIGLLPALGLILEYVDILPLGLVDETLAAVISMVGAVIAIIGRWKAESKIRGWF